MIDTAELRRQAETTKYLYTDTEPPCAVDNMLMHEWVETINPAAVIELLDRLDAAEQFINDFKRSREKFLDMSGAHEYGSFNISELHRLHKRALEWQEATK